MTKLVKSAVMTAPQQIEEANRAIFPPAPGEVELRVAYVGLCGTDIHAYYSGSPVFDFPVVFGHEFSAQVLHCGEGVHHLEEGQWVAVAPLLSCGDCLFCSTGNPHLCEQRVIFGAKVDGALRERLTMPSETLYPLPSGVLPQEGALGEPLAVAVHAVNRLGCDLEGLNTIICGAGAIGLLIAMVLEKRGVNQITLLEIDEKRRLFAEQMGFHVAHPGDAPLSMADGLFIATDASEAIAAIPELLAPLGTGIVVGIIPTAQLNWVQLLFKEGKVSTSRYFTFDDFQEATRLLSLPGFRARFLIQDQADFAELVMDQGQRIMDRAQQVLRLLIKI